MAAPAAAPTAFNAALSATQQRSVQKYARRELRRESGRWLRKGFMKVATLGPKEPESDMHVQSLQVDGHEEHDGVTYFRIRVKSRDGGLEWHVRHRYSDFDKLREKLDVKDNLVGSIFPRKTLSSCKGQEIQQRQQILQTWLDGLIAEFSSGGDCHHALLPLYRTSSLATLHSFCGVDGIGCLLPNATLAPVAPMSEAMAMERGLFWASAPPLSVEALEEDAAPISDRRLYQTALLASVLGEDPTARPHMVEREAVQESATAGTEDEQVSAALEASVASHALEDASRRARDAENLAAACRAEELLLRQKMEQAETERIALEKAEAEEAERQVEEARRTAEEDARRKAEEEEKARLVAEQDALRKAEEEAARSKAEEEEALRRKAEEEANKPYLEQAVNMAGAGKQLEDQGQTEEACDCYKTSIALFTLAQRKEKSQKVRDAIQLKIGDLTTRSSQLSEAAMAAEAARVAMIMGEPSQDASLLDRMDALLAAAPKAEAARVAPLPALAPAASAAVAQ